MSKKIAVITGAGRGLGRSMALHLARAGTDIVGTYRENKAEAEAAAVEIERAGAKAIMLRLDVSDKRQIDAFAARLPDVLDETFGRRTFDFLINNAGIGLNRPFQETTEEQFDALFAINVKAPFFLTQALLPAIADGGSIVNLSSGLARFSLPGNSAYGATKGAIEVLTRYMAREFGDRKITANVVAPGAIETDFGGGVVRDNPEVNARVTSQIPLGRVGQPDDVGAAVAALLVNAGHWINGTRIEVSGGQNL
ncbi:MAG TPA: SDR family oxidoreductase [Candidatus Limnocylindria bacterium]|nr:SDR family oxidoreductase [Candidatus Limnocylindria bacterium]